MTNQSSCPDRSIAPEHKLPVLTAIQAARKYALDNGIPVYIFEDAQTEVCAIDLVFFSGTFEQEHALQAHLTGSMLKEGCEGYSAEALSEFFEYHGASVSAAVFKNESVISLRMLASGLPAVLPVFATMITRPTFPSDELEAMKARKKQSFVTDLRRVKTVASRLFNASVFGNGHPYGKLATVADYDLPSGEWLSGYAGQHYVSNNCAMVVSGNITGRICDLLNDAFSAMPQGDVNVTTFSCPPFSGPEQMRVHEALENTVQSAVYTGRTLFGKTDPSYYSFAVTNTLFGGYFGSRLMKNIREDKGYTYGIYSYHESLKYGGVFGIVAETASAYTLPVIDEIFAELHRLRTESVSEDELSLVKRYLAGILVRTFDGVLSCADVFRSNLIHNINIPEFYMNFFKEIQKITPDDISLMARTCFDPEKMLVATAGKLE